MRILVVEDQLKMASFVQKGLMQAGYVADHAPDSIHADELMSENEYDLVILDIMLPGKTGLDIAREIRKDGFQGPILMLTALSDTKNRVSGLDAGADDYLTKPFSFEELLARVRALLRRSVFPLNSTGSALALEDLTMDLATREVIRRGQAIRLTLREFSLLEFLFRNKGRPVTRAAIAEHVWDIQYGGNSNAIDVCVNSLRKKVDHGFDKKLIHTVTGVGYVLKSDS